jgi:RNA polymerase sigma-70 factor (ECF subfamily)
MHMDQTRRELFQSAVEQFADSIYRVAYRMSGSHELVQETFMAAWKNLHQIQQPDRIRYWLMGILRNQFTKQLSQETRHRHEVLNLQTAIASLDDNQRLPILLTIMEGWSTEDVAELLGVPRGTILSRLHRGRQKLKTILASDWESEAKYL